MLIPTEDGPGEYDPDSGLVTVDGATRPLTDAEAQMLAATEAYTAALGVAADAAEVVDSTRSALTAVLALLPSMPLPDPADQAQAQAQVNAALEAYRALDVPPADVVDLANKVSTHLQSNAYERSQEARAAYAQGDAVFLADPTVTLPQLIAQVRALTAQLAVVRDA